MSPPSSSDLAEPVRKRDGDREARVQAACVEYVRLVAPDALIFAIPNGGLRSKVEAARLKWTGVLAGAPDVCVITEGGKAHFIEFKTPLGSLSTDQKKVVEKLNDLRVPFVLARSIDDVRAAFANWGIPTREVISDEKTRAMAQSSTKTRRRLDHGKVATAASLKV